MKKLIPLLVLLAGPSGALAQGTVLFDNGVLVGRPEVTYPYIYDTDGTTRLVNTPGSDSLRAQLLYGTSPTSLTPHTGLARFRPSTTTSPGTWRGLDASDTLNRSLPIGGVGTTIFLQVRYWDATTANLTFDQAVAGGLKWGQVPVFSYTQGNSSPPATTDTFMLNFEGIPEPSVLGLAIVGAGAVLLLRRQRSTSQNSEL